MFPTKIVYPYSPSESVAVDISSLINPNPSMSKEIFVETTITA